VFRQNHLFVKMLLSGIPLFRVMTEDSKRFSRQKFSESLSAIRTIVPSRPDAHLSTIPSVRTTCLTVRMLVKPSIIRPDDVQFPSGRLSSPSRLLSVIDQLQILSKFNLREDCFNRQNDVDSRPDALIHKA
jgi:hypothetical protein